MWDTVKEKTSAAFNWIKEKASTFFNNAKEKVKAFIEHVQEKVKAFKDKVVETLKELFENAKQKFEEMIKHDLENPPFEIYYPKDTGFYGVKVTTDGHGDAVATIDSGATGTVVGLAAEPHDGYEFDKWTVVKGGVSIVDNQFTIGTANVVIRADFVAE